MREVLNREWDPIGVLPGGDGGNLDEYDTYRDKLASMIGANAGEVMAVVQTAMMADLPYTRLREADYAHPTFSEGLNFLFSNVPPRAGK